MISENGEPDVENVDPLGKDRRWSIGAAGKEAFAEFAKRLENDSKFGGG